MKELAKILSVILALALLLCLGGCGKSEAEYRSAIAEHMLIEHDVLSVNSCGSFKMKDDGGASATVSVTAEVYDGAGTIEMQAHVSVDKDGSVSCSWCR